jgi:hypothetical protein
VGAKRTKVWQRSLGNWFALFLRLGAGNSGSSAPSKVASRTPEWLPGVREAADHEDHAGGHWAD